MIVVSASWFNCHILGGWIYTDRPEAYEDGDVLTDGIRHCVWHRTEQLEKTI